MQEPEATKYYISNASGSGECLEAIKKTHTAREVSLLPFCSIAVPQTFLVCSDKIISSHKCYFYCFLPLPEISHFHMHINGDFQLQQSRRALHATADNSLKTLWNKSLIDDALVNALLNFILYMTEKIFISPNSLTQNQIDRFYQFWPSKCESESVLWVNYSDCVAHRIIESDIPVFYCSHHPNRWISFQEASFFIHSYLCREFEAFLYSYVSSSHNIYFINLPTSHSLHSTLVSILVKDARKVYTLELVCRDLIIPNIDTITRDRGHAVTFLLLKNCLELASSEPWIIELLSDCCCIPCGGEDDEDFMLRMPRDTVDPNSFLTNLFFSNDYRKPHARYSELYNVNTNCMCYKSLISLNIITSKLPMQLLVERCAIQCEDRFKLSTLILKYLNITDFSAEEKNDIKLQLEHIHFIPVWIDETLLQISDSLIEFYPPTKCFLYEHRYLLSPSIRAVHPDLSMSMYSALQLLGCTDNAITTGIVIELIRFLHSKSEAMRNLLINIEDRMKCIYTWIFGICSTSAESLTNLQNELSNVPWIWSQHLYIFYPISHVTCDIDYLNYNSGFLIPFPFKDMLDKTNMEILESLGVKTKVTFSDAIIVLQSMKGYYVDRELPDRNTATDSRYSNDECGLVISLINNVIADETETAEQYYLLTETKCLQASDTLFYNDIPWMTDKFSNEERSMLVHNKITKLASYQTGAQSKMETYYESDNFTLEEFGPFEDIERRIKNILREYPPDISIIKELIQNAEDASATRIAFIIDNTNNYGETTLCKHKDLHPKWKSLQRCPSLLIYNNTAFTKEDLDGIRSVGLGGKQGRKSIGKFGLGFNAVYHITDTPCLLTADADGENTSFCIFDPFRKILSLRRTQAPGVKLAFTNNRLDIFPDQFAPFFNETLLKSHSEIFHNLVARKDFSLFRLPLGLLNQREKLPFVKKLMEELLKVASEMLIFLRHIKQIDILEITQDGQNIIHSGSVISKDIEVTNARINDIIYTVLNREVTTITRQSALHSSVESNELLGKLAKRAARDNSSEVHRWLVYHCEGELDNFVRAHEIQQFEQQYIEEKLRVFGSLAVRLPSADWRFHSTGSTSFLYSYLPFGVKHTYPICVNAPFILDPHRKFVSYLNQASGQGSWDFVWHQNIIKQILSLLYFQLLLDLKVCKVLPDNWEIVDYYNWYYSLYPTLHYSENSSNSEGFLTSLSQTLYHLLADNNSHILLFDDSCFKTWYPITGELQGVFINSSQIVKYSGSVSMYSSLARIGYRITFAPGRLFNSFAACNLQCRMIDQQHLINYININMDCFCKPGYTFSCHLNDCKLDFDELNQILEYLLQHKSELSGNAKIPLMVDCQDTLRVFTNQHSSTFVSTYSNLLPHLSHMFINPKYSKDMVNTLTNKGYVGNLTCQYLAANLHVPENPPVAFYMLFWTFIVDSGIHPQTLNDQFRNNKLVPIVFGDDATITFIDIAHLLKIATSLIDEDFIRILKLLKCPFLKLPKPNEVVLYDLPAIQQYLHGIAITDIAANSILLCISLGKNIACTLIFEDAKLLRQLFNSLFNLKKMDCDLNNALVTLKIFLTDDSSLCSLNQFHLCYVNSDKLPITDNLTHRLIKYHQLGILSNSDSSHLIKHICSSCGIKMLTIFDLVKYIIQLLYTLPKNEVKRLLRYIFNLKCLKEEVMTEENYIEENWNYLYYDLVSVLKETKFIHNSLGDLVRPCDLYAPSVEIFQVYKKHKLITEDWIDGHIYPILEKLELKINPEPYFLLECAERIESGEFTDDHHIELVIQLLSTTDFSNCNPSIVKQIGETKFVPMIKACSVQVMSDTFSDFRSIQSMSVLGRFRDGQLRKFYSICYSTCWIYSHRINVSTNIMQLLGIPLEPPVENVIEHLKHVISLILSNTEILSNAKLLSNTESAMMDMYQFLNKKLPKDLIVEFHDGNKFENCLMCKYDKTVGLFRPINLVFEEIDGFGSFLFSVPPKLKHIQHFLECVGVCKTPTHRHYISVLNDIRAIIGNLNIIGTPYKSIVELAFQCLIKDLRKCELTGCEVNLKNCLLLTEKLRLCPYKSQALIYADNRRLLHYLKKSGQLQHSILTPLQTDSNGSLAPPRCLQLRYISDLYKVTINPNTYLEDNKLIMDMAAQKYNDQIQSEEFKNSLIRLYFHETQKILGDILFNKKEIINAKNHTLSESEDNQDILSLEHKISMLQVEAVNTINMIITNENGERGAYDDACVCILDEDRNTILIKAGPEAMSKVQIEIALELDKYLCYLFKRMLIYLQICLVYPLDELDDVLDSFDISKPAH